MEKPKNTKAGCATVFVIFIVIFFVLFKCCGGGGSGNNSSGSTSSKASLDFTSAELTEDNIKAAITDKNVKDKISAVKIDKSNITVAVYNEDFWDEKSIIKQNQPNSAGVFQDLFKNKSVKSVSYAVFIPVNDAYGKKSEALAITSTLDRENADKVSDWKTFKYEAMSQYYSVVKFKLAPESSISGLHKAWMDVYE